MRKNLHTVVVAIAVLIFGVEGTKACTCFWPIPLARSFARADAVFMGRVVSFEYAPEFDERLAVFEVQQVWKGKASWVDSVYTPENEAICGYDFHVGETYIVYADKFDENHFFTHICTRTAPFEFAGEDLEYLENLSLYPLSVDNRWNFARSYAESIADTVRVDGKFYYRFTSFRHFPDLMVRLQDDGRLFVRTDTTDEHLWLDFNAGIGNSFEVHDPYSIAHWTVTLESTTDTVKTAAGEFFPCYRFYFDFHGADNDWIEWYTPNLGPVKLTQIGFAYIEYPLESAVIDGSEVPNGVDENPGEVSSFALEQNYPNPYSVNAVHSLTGATEIRYHLTQTAPVTMTIYDLLGREVVRFANGLQSPGDHGIFWNGLDSRNALVPSGIYFYRLQVGNVAKMRKLTLIR